MKNGARTSEPRVAALERKILELERTVQLLDEARSHYADHYDFAPLGFITLDAHGCILELNVMAARWLGRERALLVGMPLLPFVEKAHAPVFLHHLRECQQSPEKQGCEVALVAGRAGPRLVELLSVPVMDTSTGRTVHRTVLRDVTKSRRIERALRQSEERFATAFRASPSAVAITTLEEGRYVDVNASFCQLTGLARTEIIGRTSVELGFYPDAETREEHIVGLRGGGSARNLECQVRTKAGAPRDVLISVEQIVLDGQPCLLTIGQDVTELKRLQREVLEISEREQSRIGQDLHDGPCQSFTGMAMLAEVVARDLDREHSALAEKVRDISRMVREGADEMRRLAAGLYPVKIQRDGLACALEDLAAETTGRCEVHCRFNMPKPITITGESTIIHLYRIAQEAVNNAIRHGRAKSIWMELSSEDGATITLSICDDGIGLPSALPEKRGLGLHSMEYRARMLGGSFQAGPAGGRGTAVVCSFPGKDFAYAG